MKNRLYQVTVTLHGANTEEFDSLLYFVKAADKEHAKTVAMERFEQTKAKHPEILKNATAEIKPDNVLLWG